MIKILAVSIAAFTLLSSSVNAQNQPQPCQSDPHFRDFDFWLGNWEVKSRANGKVAGNNSITSIENGCAVFESWKSATGGTGISTNHYNPLTKKWRQVWLSAGSYSIDIEGGLENGAMHLVGHIWYYTNNTSFPIRGTWTPNEDGTVRQLFEQYNPSTEKWDLWFDGIYTRMDKAE
ncbi:hypothetical protein [Kordiimonas laminariae]|uniref:hypothetical protein n=1 Tax=Kordiimonas laminariae TaxID=2917717 RepID=UPI001FF315CD|nr:hypothetical protein [Kordiimonas laminariae]MCK0069830.1 hypothetical protein [Kordiimonas laminariae]